MILQRKDSANLAESFLCDFLCEMSALSMATNDQEHSQRLGAEYLNLAFKDYIAARTLLNNNMLLQGTGLASSAIEKYLKAYALFAGKPLRRHLDPEFIESLKNGPGIPPYLSENFLLFLANCYRLRYFDNMPYGHSLVIRRRQLLAELDELVSIFEGAFTLKRDGRVVNSLCRTAIHQNDPRVFDENHILAKQDKTAFIEQHDAVYEVRFDQQRGIMEATFYTISGKNDGDFLKPGLVPDQNGREYQMSVMPLNHPEFRVDLALT